MAWYGWIPIVGKIIENAQENRRRALELKRLKLEQSKCEPPKK